MLTVFFGDHIEPARLGSLLRAQRAEHQAKLEAYEAMRPDVPGEFHRATLELGVAYERTIVDWIDGLPWTATEPKRAARKSRTPR